MWFLPITTVLLWHLDRWWHVRLHWYHCSWESRDATSRLSWKALRTWELFWGQWNTCWSRRCWIKHLTGTLSLTSWAFQARCGGSGNLGLLIISLYAHFQGRMVVQHTINLKQESGALVWISFGFLIQWIHTQGFWSQPCMKSVKCKIE